MEKANGIAKVYAWLNKHPQYLPEDNILDSLIVVKLISITQYNGM